MRKAVWIWVAVAFVLGLLPGAGLFLYTRNSSLATRRQLVSDNSSLQYENQNLQSRLNAAEASVSALSARVAQWQSAGGTVQTSANGTTTATGSTTSGPPTVKERSVSPAETSGGGNILLTAKLTGHAEKVNMRIVSKDGSFDKTYFLARSADEGPMEVWQSEIDAPRDKGEYRYFAIAYAGGQKYPMPGVSGWTFQVK